MDLRTLFIIIPVHNRKIFTRECLISLRNQTCKGFKIIVINDGSTDGTKEMIKSEFTEVIMIEGNGNLWWTKATNLGIKYAFKCKAQYILTLNDDTILTNNFIEKMYYWATKEKDALLGSLALDYYTKKPEYGGEIINWKRAKFNSLLKHSAANELTGLHKVSHYPGRGLLIPIKVFSDIGFYDEKNFPQIGADLDFTFRAKKNGFEIYCNYDAKLYARFEESGDYQLRKKKSLKNYFRHLFDKKGGGNLRVFTMYAIKYCPKKFLPSFLIIGILKRIFGYLFEWFNEIFFQQESG